MTSVSDYFVFFQVYLESESTVKMALLSKEIEDFTTFR
jgi:hypothetical protein